jgi:hypothetical protein
MIVGQKTHPTQGLQYLVQNSWGPDCSGYHSRWTCLKGQGALWIDAQVLLDSSTALFWVD